MLAVIPARKNSKGIPGKNVVEVHGRPLIAWTIEAARKSPSIERVVVSTDCVEIAKTSRSWGAETPFMRPTELALDNTPGTAPVIHACQQLPGYESVILLQPTSPLRDSSHIEAAIEKFREEQVDFLVSVTQPKHHPNWVFAQDNQGNLQKWNQTPIATTRQSLAKCFALNGAIYIATVERLLETETFLTSETRAFEMSPEDSIDIDSPADLIISQALLNARLAVD